MPAGLNAVTVLEFYVKAHFVCSEGKVWGNVSPGALLKFWGRTNISKMAIQQRSPNGSTHLSLPTQLLQRHLERITGKNILVTGLYQDDAVLMLDPVVRGRPATFLVFDYAAYLRGQSAMVSARDPQHSILYSAWYRPAGPVHDCAVVYLQKGKEANQLVLGMVANAIAPAATVLLVGENSAGIRSARQLLEDHIGPISFSDAARHSVLYEAHAREVPPPSAVSSLDAWAREFPFHAGNREMKAVSFPGIFSHGRIDKGTGLLLNHLPKGLNGKVLDFGCGYGIIGAAIKALSENCRVVLTDSNAFAIEASNRTFRINNLQPEAIVPSNVFSNISGTFDWIISNPPFHQGVGTDYQVVSQFLSGSVQHLRPGGSLVIVANRFLHYESIMERSLGSATVLANDNAYKVVLSRKAGGNPI